MKKVILIFGLLLTAMIMVVSCSKENTEQEEVLKNEPNLTKIASSNPPIINNSMENGYRGSYGGSPIGKPGSVTTMTGGCSSFVNGYCHLHDSFGGGTGNPTTSLTLIENDKVRVSFLNQRGIVNVEDVIGDLQSEQWEELEELTGQSREEMANFIQNHFNIPNQIPFTNDLNMRFIERYQLSENVKLYTVPGEYEIFNSEENPYGYFDMDIEIQE